MTQLNVDNQKDIERAEAIEVKVDETNTSQAAEAQPVAISETVELKVNVDPNDPVELIKAIFIQFGTDYSQTMRTQLDNVEGAYTLTSFGNPTLQFMYHSDPKGDKITEEEMAEIKRTVYVSGFPADDAVGILEMVLNMQKRLSAKGFDIAIAGVIAPVQTGDGHNVIISDFEQVMALSARAAFLSGRASLKRLEDAQNAAKAAEHAAAEAKTESSEVESAETAPKSEEKTEQETPKEA